MPNPSRRLLLAAIALPLLLSACDWNNRPAPPTPVAAPGGGWPTAGPADPAAPALIEPSSTDGALRLKPGWTLAAIEYGDQWWGLGTPGSKSDRITREGESYTRGPTAVPGSDVQALLTALDHLYPAQMLMAGHAWTDDYPSWAVELTGTDGQHVLLFASSTGNPGNGPWTVLVNGLLYAQYDGTVAPAIGKLFGGRLGVGTGPGSGPAATTGLAPGRAPGEVQFSTAGLPPQLLYGFWGLLPISDGFSYQADLEGSQIAGHIRGQGHIGSMRDGETTQLVGVQLTSGSGAPVACPITTADEGDSWNGAAGWNFTCPVVSAQKGQPYRYLIQVHFRTAAGATHDASGELWGTWAANRAAIILPAPPDIAQALRANAGAADLLTDHLLGGTDYSAVLTASAPLGGTREGEALFYGQTTVNGKPLRYTAGGQFVMQAGQIRYWTLDRAALNTMLAQVGQLPLTRQMLAADPQLVLNLWYGKNPGPAFSLHTMDSHMEAYAAQVNPCGSVPGGAFPSGDRPLIAFGYSTSPYFYRAPFVLIDGQAVVSNLGLDPSDHAPALKALRAGLPAVPAGTRPFRAVLMESNPYGGGGPTLHFWLPPAPTAAEQATYTATLKTLPVPAVAGDTELVVPGVTLAVGQDGQLSIAPCTAPAPTAAPHGSGGPPERPAPHVVYATLYGATQSGSDRPSTSADALAIDGAGHAYISGMTSDNNLPLKNAYDSTKSGDLWDLFLAGMEPDGSALHYASYLGSGTETTGAGVAVDHEGNIYLTGSARAGFHTTDKAIQTSGAGDADAYVIKLSADGRRIIYATLLGGQAYDTGLRITVDAQGAAYVLGTTESTDFPVEKPLQAHYAGSGGKAGSDVFVAKISPDGTKLVYSTYLGGKGAEAGYGITVDAAGNAFVTGATNSADFPLAHPLQAKLAGDGDAFVAKISADGSHLVYSTFLGGGQGSKGQGPNAGAALDLGAGIAVDGAGNAYVTGNTTASDFPLVTPLYSTFNGGVPFAGRAARDAFVAALNPAGSALLFSTLLGGGGDDRGRGIGLDAQGNIYVGGSTTSTDFPLVRPLQKTYAGAQIGLAPDSFIAKLTPGGTRLDYSTYFGGPGFDDLVGFAVDPKGNVYFAGQADEEDKDSFPVSANAFQKTVIGIRAAYIVKIAGDAP